ncbi:hypothetical protein REJC140_02822 [Pseudorhizobium endolithicum]|uniref:Uncharacterized protein n=1 Tax=Pseudorhizobium endolithicum TaxID=1191678 RepID=A0ABM8PHF0_9HYPH|nr:hypothetical protein [Pseudorhizobium endolithicum]CAD7030358.1 hypothetical protein REJC140_02822 [Pseudorhizobium endolithicum]
MLPPLGAALSASTDYQTAGRHVIRPLVAATAAASVPSSPSPVSYLSSGRLDLLSLSGQLHLAQGLSIFAETVGNYLKISRREGESLVDYAHRLAEGLKSLTAAQRAVLEQALMQLTRSMTLRMLTEILENPLGPEAARLNAYIETGQVSERDPAARAVVSSYRQNAASEPWASHPALARLSSAPSYPPGGAPPSLAGSQSVAVVPPQTEAGLPDAAGGVVASQPQRAGEIGLAGGASSRPTPQQPPHAEAIMAVKPDLTEGNVPASREAASPARPGGVAASAMPPQDDLSGGEIPAQQRRAASPSHPAGNPAPAEASRPASIRGAVVIYDAPELVRMAQRLEEGRPLPQDVRYLAGRISGGSPAAEGSGGAKGFVPPGASLSTYETTGSSDPAADIPGLTGNAAGKPAASSLLNTDVAATAPLPVPASSVPNAVQEGGVERLIEQALFLPMAAPAVVREGLVPAFVAYPAVPGQPDEDERDVERLSPVDEDGEGHQAGHDRRQEGEEAPAESEEPEEGQASDPDRPDEAQDLYWRMADLA